jgi:AhpD family alkylhydroperoxidase
MTDQSNDREIEQMLLAQAIEAFENLAAVTITDNGVLDQKTTVLAGLAAALALGCATCIERFLERAREAGVTESEVGTVQAVVMTVSAGRIRNHFAASPDDQAATAG